MVHLVHLELVLPALYHAKLVLLQLVAQLVWMNIIIVGKIVQLVLFNVRLAQMPNTAVFVLIVTLHQPRQMMVLPVSLVPEIVTLVFQPQLNVIHAIMITD